MPSLSFFHKKGAALQAERPKRVGYWKASSIIVAQARPLVNRNFCRTGTTFRGRCRMCLNCKRFVKFSQIHRKRLFKRHATCYNTDKDKGNRLPDPDLCLPH